MIHDGHKKRLRDKAFKDIDSLQPHEIIELLLNFSIIRKNTNPIAHELIEKFGSVSNIMDSDVSSLMQIQGIGESSASLLVLIPKLCEIYNKSRCAEYSKIPNIAEAQDYFRTLFSTTNHEIIYALCLDKSDKIISLIKLEEGDIDTINVNIAKILVDIAKLKPSKIYISHNHIVGGKYPSDADITFTDTLNEKLENLGIVLVDHIIVNRNETFSFKMSELL